VHAHQPVHAPDAHLLFQLHAAISSSEMMRTLYLSHMPLCVVNFTRIGKHAHMHYCEPLFAYVLLHKKVALSC